MFFANKILLYVCMEKMTGVYSMLSQKFELIIILPNNIYISLFSINSTIQANKIFKQIIIYLWTLFSHLCFLLYLFFSNSLQIFIIFIWNIFQIQLPRNPNSNFMCCLGRKGHGTMNCTKLQGFPDTSHMHWLPWEIG